MSFVTILFIAIGLAMDAFAVSIITSLNLKVVTGRQIFRLCFHCGFFQFMMPVIGWYLGSAFSKYISNYDHWVAFLLLAAIGGKMIYESFEDEENEASASGEGKGAASAPVKDPTRGLSLLFLVVATSIDALAVGISLAMLKIDIWYPSAVIGVVTFLMTVLGMKIGEKLGRRFGENMELTGGIILIGIGLKIVLEHTMA